MGIAESYFDDPDYPDYEEYAEYPVQYKQPPYNPYPGPPYNPYKQPQYSPYSRPPYDPYRQPYYSPNYRPAYKGPVQQTYQQYKPYLQCVPTPQYGLPLISTSHSPISISHTVHKCPLCYSHPYRSGHYPFEVSTLPNIRDSSYDILHRLDEATRYHPLEVSASRKVCDPSCGILYRQDEPRRYSPVRYYTESPPLSTYSVKKRRSKRHHHKSKKSHRRSEHPVRITIVDQRSTTSDVQAPLPATFSSGQNQLLHPNDVNRGTYVDYWWQQPQMERPECREQHSYYDTYSRSCSPTILEAISCQEKMVSETRKLRKIMKTMLEQQEPMSAGCRHTVTRNVRSGQSTPFRQKSAHHSGAIKSGESFVR